MAAPADLRGGGVGCVTQPVKFCELNKLWIEMIDLIHVEMNTAAAYNNFISKNYTQHSLYVLSGWQNGLTALKGFFTPAINATFLNQGIQGTVGYVHWRLDQPDMAPTAVVDIYRWEGSCVVEHWDVMQALPDNASNPLALGDLQDGRSLKWWLMVNALIRLTGGDTYSEAHGIGKITADLGGKADMTLFRIPILNGEKLDENPGDLNACYIGDSQGRDGMNLDRGGMTRWVLEEIDARKWIRAAPFISNN